MDESRRWVEFGRWLVEQREERGLRRREAAKRAKVPEATWRDLETGRKEVIGGIRLLPNPSKDVLERVAGALELPVEDVIARIGAPPTSGGTKAVSANGAVSGSTAGAGAARSRRGADPSDWAALTMKLRRLTERDRALVEQLVDAMLQQADG